MSSDSRSFPAGQSPRLPRPYQLIVMVDAKTLKAVKRLQGTGAGKLSRSEVGYRLLMSALAAEESAELDEADRAARIPSAA